MPAKRKKKKSGPLKKILAAVAIVLGILLLALTGFAGYLTLTEYKPEDAESVEIRVPVFDGSDVSFAKASEEDRPEFSGDTFSVLSMNIGYAALGKDSDFFMDGGSQTRPDSADTVRDNLKGIISLLQEKDADFVFLQEADYNSKRSWKVNEKDSLAASMNAESAFALNYSCSYVPYPLPDTLGEVRSGLLTLSNFHISSAVRYSLPCPFSWPVSLVNLKRCLLVTRIPLEGTSKELVLVNLHLEAYDDGEGKVAQTKQLMTFLETEYSKGNYVVAGGDFNQIFPGSGEIYENTHGDLWTPGRLEDSLGEGWRYVCDLNVPSCRLLNRPYDPDDTENTQYYVIDGFIVSPNLTVNSAETLDEGFVFSDHNPVLVNLTLN